MAFERKYSDETIEAVKRAKAGNPSLSYRALGLRFGIPSTRTIYDILHQEENQIRYFRKHALSTLKALIEILEKVESESGTFPFETLGALTYLVIEGPTEFEDIRDVGINALIFLNEMGFIKLNESNGKELVVLRPKNQWRKEMGIYHDLQEFKEEEGGNVDGQ